MSRGAGGRLQKMPVGQPLSRQDPDRRLPAGPSAREEALAVQQGVARGRQPGAQPASLIQPSISAAPARETAERASTGTAGPEPSCAPWRCRLLPAGRGQGPRAAQCLGLGKSADGPANLRTMKAWLLVAALLGASPSLAGENLDKLAAEAGARFDGSAAIPGHARGAFEQAEAAAPGPAAPGSRTSVGSEPRPAEFRRRWAPEAPTPKAGIRREGLLKAAISGGMTAAGNAVTKHGGLIVGGIVGTQAAAQISNPVLAVVVGLSAGLAGAFIGGAAIGALGKLAKDYVVPRLPSWFPGSARGRASP